MIFCVVNMRKKSDAITDRNFDKTPVNTSFKSVEKICGDMNCASAVL